MTELLTEDEKTVIGECLRAAVDGPFFADFTEDEHHTIFGISPAEMARVASAWPQVDEDDDIASQAVHTAMLNLWGYPHRRRKDRPQFISVPEAEVERIFQKWRQLQRSKQAQAKASRVPPDCVPTSDLNAPYPPRPTHWSSVAVEGLQRGEIVRIRPRGDSMRGRIDDGDFVTLAPCTPDEIAAGDVVLARIQGKRYEHLVLHLVWEHDEEQNRFLIGNNHGRSDGWVDAESIFGKVIQIETLP